MADMPGFDPNDTSLEQAYDPSAKALRITVGPQPLPSEGNSSQVGGSPLAAAFNPPTPPPTPPTVAEGPVKGAEAGPSIAPATEPTEEEPSGSGLISSAQAQEPTGREKDLMNLFAAAYSNETNTGQNVHPSSAGAEGPMQVMPDTFNSYAKPGETIDDWKSNTSVGQRILTDLYDKYDGDMDKTLIGYNAGEKWIGKFTAAGNDPSVLPQETQAYLARAHRIWGGPGNAQANEQRQAAVASTGPVDLATMLGNWDKNGQLPVGITTHASAPGIDLKTMAQDWDAQDKLVTAYPSPPLQGNAFLHAMSYWPGFAGRAVAAAIGMPGDLMSMAAQYTANHPEMIAPMEGAGGFTAGPGPGTPQEQQEAQQLGQRVAGALPTTENLRTAYGNISPTHTALPSELGDTAPGEGVNEMFGYPAIAMATLGIRGAAAGGVPLATAAWRTAMNAAKGAYIFGIGDELGRSVTGGEAGTPSQQAATAAWSTGLEALRVGASVLMHKGISSGAAGAQAITGKISPEQAMMQSQSQPTEQNLMNMATQPETVPGFTVPAATASGDKGLQTLLFAATRGDRLAQARFNSIFEQNHDAVERAFGLPVGNPQDTVAHFQSQLGQDRAVMQQGLQAALNEATRAFDVARQDSKIGLDTQAGAMLRGQVLGAAVRGADDLLDDYADFRWQQAREAGVMTVPVTNMESDIGPALLRLAQQAVKSGQGNHFPWDALAPFFKNASQDGLFDADGNIKAGLPSAGKIIDQWGNPIRQTSPSGLPQFRKEQFTIQDIHQAASDVKAQARGERKAVSSPNLQGDPIQLRYYSAIGQELNSGIDRNLANMPLDMNDIYRRATAATANYYKLMHRGPIGALLGRDLEGGSSIDPMQTFDKLNPNGLPGIVATNQLFSVTAQLQQIEQEAQNGGLGPSLLQQISTQHPADRLAQAFGDALRQDFTTALYQQGSKGAGNWLQNHSVVLDHYPEMKAQFTAAVASGSSLENLSKVGLKHFEEAQANSVASNFLGGDGAGSVDMVTKSRLPGQAMSNLLAATGRDSTGAASRGVAQLLVNRMQAEGATAGGGYDARKTTAFFNRMLPAFQTLDDHGILDISKVRRIVDSIAQSGRMSQNPAIVGANAPLNSFSLRALARRGMQILGARIVGRLGHGLGVGGIQAAQIGSSMGAQGFDQFFDSIFQRLSPGQARNLAVDALFDPNVYKQITQPAGATLAEKAENLHHSLEVWAAPSILGQRASAQTPAGQDTSKGAGSEYLPR